MIVLKFPSENMVTLTLFVLQGLGGGVQNRAVALIEFEIIRATIPDLHEVTPSC